LIIIPKMEFLLLKNSIKSSRRDIMKIWKSNDIKDTIFQKKDKFIVLAMIGAFLLWSVGFIFRASFIAIDGHRYYSLFDDAMISMRYAWNLSHGYGLVWNHGERVEGYTNFLMVIIMAIPNAIFEKRLAALTIQLFGIFTIILNAFVVMKIVLIIEKREAAPVRCAFAILSLICSLAYYPIIFWSLMGMETGLVSLLISIGILIFLVYRERHSTASLLAISSFLGLAYLTRPDSLIPSLVILIFGPLIDLLQAKQTKEKTIRILVLLGGFAFLPVTQLLFRIWYYGTLVPNTYILKVVGTPFWFRVVDGIHFIAPFVVSVIFIIIISIIGLILKPRRLSLLFMTLLIGLIAYQVYVGGDAWLYWRILASVIPLVFLVYIRAIYDLLPTQGNLSWRMVTSSVIVCLFGSYYIVSTLFSKNPRLATGLGTADKIFLVFGVGIVVIGFTLYWIYRLLTPKLEFIFHMVLLSSLAIISINIAFLPEIALRVRPYTVEENIIMVNRAIAISDITTSDATVGVFYAGAIPYYTGLRGIDFLGKSDRYIAALAPDLSGSVSWYGLRSVPGHNKYDLYYSIVELLPTYIQGTNWGAQDVTENVEQRYIEVQYKGINLLLKKNDPNVLWDKVETGYYSP
jgi:arabinofuranosyltransferase